MKNFTLEVCVDSTESALAAKAGGATRLELCANTVIGGTTPTMSLFRQVKELTGLPIHVIIRPRFGDFLYSEYEYRQMCEDISTFAKEGAAAAVIGSLNADGTLNLLQMKGMIGAAGDMKVTMHRAFDVCVNPYEALEQAVELGISTILTSGQRADAYAGRKLIAELIRLARGRIEILAGAGVDAAVISGILKETEGAAAFHMSGKTVLDSGMSYRNADVSMGLPGISEFQIFRTSEEKIRDAYEVLSRA